MNFLEWMGFNKVVKDTADVLEFPKPKVVPPVPPVAPPKPQPKEHYRVGHIAETNMTTLTIISHDGWGSITLTMNQPACEQMIKMLRATYSDDEPSPDDDPNGGLPLPVEDSEAKVA